MTASPSTRPRDDRVVRLEDDRRIVIRPARARDDVDIMRLYDTLDEDDHFRRFFGSIQPQLTFYSAMATVGERGGARLVAVLCGPPPTEDRIIGEAGYTKLPNGDGELSMVVAKRWRGWLGPYLLDALVETAAAAGVPNLEADVLTVNRPMLALLRSRRSVVMSHEDWSVVRLIIGTNGRTPTWPGEHEHPRVLVEGAGDRWHAEGEARSAGLQVLTCPGPSDGLRPCPLLEGKPCPLAAAADVIVVSHPPDDDRWNELLSAHAELHPGVPVCLEPSPVPTEGVKPPVTICPVVDEQAVVNFVGRLAKPVPADGEPVSGDLVGE